MIKVYATPHDLWLELHARKRAALVWKGKDGREIPVDEMTDSQIVGALEEAGLFIRKKREDADERMV